MTDARELALQHRFEPGSAEQPTLLLLHGTGGDENDLLPLGRALLPGAALLSPRGAVLERGQPRFFRRLAEGVFDLEDLRVRTAELATFVREAAATYELDARRIVAVGFSNGANIAASLMLSDTGVLAGARAAAADGAVRARGSGPTFGRAGAHLGGAQRPDRADQAWWSGSGYY